MKQPLALLAILCFTVACSDVNKAKKNMDNMSDTTDKMSQTTDKMESTTDNMYQQVRSKEAEATRAEKFKVLNTDTAGFGTKIAAASIYFKSFEFQLWTGKGSDNKNARKKLFLDAANEFTKNMDDLYKKVNVKKMSPTNDSKKHAFEESFYAISATMHMNHHFQEELIDANAAVQSTSFYDLVKTALRKDFNGQTQEEHEEILVNGLNKEILIELVKARVDMMSALALKNLTDKRDMTLGQTIKGALFKITGGRLGSIDLPETFAKANPATKNQTIKYLDAAKKSQNFLLEIGVTKELEKTLQSAFKHIDLGDATHEPGTQDQSENEEEADAKKVEIRNLIDGLLQ